MTTYRGTWAHRLRGDSKRQTEPVCSPELIAAAVAHLGEGPVGWAVQLAEDIALRCVEVFPEFGGGAAHLVTLRWTTESSTIMLLRAIESGTIDSDVMNQDALRATQDFVHRGIPLSVVWGAMRQGHAWLAEAFMGACVALQPAGEQPRELLHVSETIFHFTDRFSEGVGRAYEAEHERWLSTTAAAREEAVKALLSGDPVDVERAERILQYRVSRRDHLGLIVWFETEPPRGSATPLVDIAASAAREAGAEQVLCAPQGLSTVLVWANGVNGFDPDKTRATLTGHPAVRAAVGAPGHGLDGFVRSHEQALRVRGLTATMPGLIEQLVCFADVRLLSLLRDDRAGIASFIRDVLGDLAADDPHVGDLRRTAAAYLRLRRSPSSVADDLFIARSTVRYRLKRAEELLGRSLDDDALELWMALELKQRLGHGYRVPARARPQQDDHPDHPIEDRTTGSNR